MRKVLRVFSAILGIVLKGVGAVCIGCGLYKLLVEKANFDTDMTTIFTIGIVSLILSGIRITTVNGDNVLWIANLILTLGQVILGLGIPATAIYICNVNELEMGWCIAIVGISIIIGLAILGNNFSEEKKPEPAPRTRGISDVMLDMAVNSLINSGQNTSSYNTGIDSYTNYSAQTASSSSNFDNWKKKEEENRKRLDEEYRRKQERDRQHREYLDEKDRKYNQWRYEQAKKTDPTEYYLNTRKYKAWAQKK